MPKLVIAVIGFAILALAVAIVITSANALAQNKTKTIAGLDNNTAQIAMDNELRFLNIAKLHNATFDQQTIHVTNFVLFGCIKTALTSQKSDFAYSLDQRFLSNCDSGFTDAIVNKRDHNNTLVNVNRGLINNYQISLVNVNQTIMNDVYAYLKSRGIQ